MKFIKYLDFAIAKKCNLLLSPNIDKITKTISWVPLSIFGWFFVVLLVSLMDSSRGTKVFMVATIAIALHFIVSEGLFKIGGRKIGIFRQRPYVAHPQEITPIGGKFSDSSFPSSHVASTAAILAVLSIFYPGFLIYALVIVLIVGFARLHNGMHYPTDILAGTMLGIIYAVTAFMLVKNIL